MINSCSLLHMRSFCFSATYFVCRTRWVPMPSSSAVAFVDFLFHRWYSPVLLNATHQPDTYPCSCLTVFSKLLRSDWTLVFRWFMLTLLFLHSVSGPLLHLPSNVIWLPNKLFYYLTSHFLRLLGFCGIISRYDKMSNVPWLFVCSLEIFTAASFK